jgi:glycerol-3-phosphate dehydrogenase
LAEATEALVHDGRLLLIMPWHGRMLTGTSHSAQPADSSDTRVRREERLDFVGEANSALPALSLSEGDVTLVHRGAVLAVRNRRGVAEQVLALISDKLGITAPPCRTGTILLPSWDFGTVSREAERAEAAAGGMLDAESPRAVVATHGTAWRALLARCERDSTLVVRIAPDLP